MDTMIKASAGVLVATVICLLLNKTGKEYALLVSIAICCLLTFSTLSFIEPVFSFLERISQIGNISNTTVKILFKALGVSLLAEFTALLCSDAGNSAMARLIQILASAVILWLSVPLFENLIDLISGILEKA